MEYFRRFAEPTRAPERPDPKRRVIYERQYGITAPSVDRNGVSRLVTAGLFPCFAVALHDRERRVGMLTHIDRTSDTAPTVARALKDMLSLGGRKFRIYTVNLASPYLASHEYPNDPAKAQEAIEGRIEAMQEVAHVFEQNGILDVEESEERMVSAVIDIGNVTGAVLDVHTGVQGVPNEQLGLTNSELTANINYLKWMNPLIAAGNPPPITCGYRPVYQAPRKKK